MRYILFDLYGLFYNLKPLSGWEEFAARLGTTAEALRPAFSRYRPDYDAGFLDIDQYWQLVGAELGIEIDWREALAADLAATGGINEEMVAFLRELQGDSIPFALLSNEPKERTEITRTHEFISWFTPAMFSCELGLAKPDPEIFKVALGRLRAVAGADLQPGEILFTDDTQDNINVAHELGFATHLFEGVDGLRAAVAEAFGK
ncbi:MAG: HAD hydrolase-like protein [Ancrocorticia sp.]